MDAALFTALSVNSRRSAVEVFWELPDGSEVLFALSRREFGAMSFQDHPSWDVAHNRMQFLRLFQLKLDNLVSPQLVHRAVIREVTVNDAGKGARNHYNGLAGVDGLVTRDSNLVLMTTHADCHPVWLVAPKSGWIGVAHVGWRGLLAGIIENLIQAIPEPDREGIVLTIGPGICVDHYQVGEEVAKKFLASSLFPEMVIERGNRFHLDLLRGIILAAGKLQVNVLTNILQCTYETAYLSSFRRDREKFTPMAAIITRISG